MSTDRLCIELPAQECGGEQSSLPWCDVLTHVWAWVARLHNEFSFIEELLVEAPAPFGACRWDWGSPLQTKRPWGEIPY